MIVAATFHAHSRAEGDTDPVDGAIEDRDRRGRYEEPAEALHVGDRTSHAHDAHQLPQPVEVGGVAGVQLQMVRVSGRRNQQIGQPAARVAAPVHRGGHHQAVAAGGCGVEGQRLESRLDLPQPRALQDRNLLPPRRITAIPRNAMTHRLPGSALYCRTHH